ncbi:MAG: phosphatidylserine decarboxylase family protein [Saprospiraceae bacterium]|nr:phosphatidylserine decarboxylase family protein [Saprospiraceae bacterium]
MRIHKEGRGLIFGTGFAALFVLFVIVPRVSPAIGVLITAVMLIIYAFLLWFFRNPRRAIPEPDPRIVYAPADGRVVAIEQVVEDEILNGPGLQISIFMSPLDVHVNRVPVNGVIAYYKYHPGKYLVAWHPKSSTENERNTFQLATPFGAIVIRQIAGAVARRIVSYPRQGDSVTQGEDLGFIKFGSRCDLIVPLDFEVAVAIGQRVVGNRTVMGRLRG